MFADEISDRLKVIACLEKPNMVHSETLDAVFGEDDWERVRKLLKAGEDDAQIVFWGRRRRCQDRPGDDRGALPPGLRTACPTRPAKVWPTARTIFERVLPGPDRMYPDTDSAPIPIEEDADRARCAQRLPRRVSQRLEQLRDWSVPADTLSPTC